MGLQFGTCCQTVEADRNSLAAGPEKDGELGRASHDLGAHVGPGFTFDRVFDQETRQVEIFEWGVKGIVEGELLFPCRVDPQLITRRCHDGFQWDAVLLWPNRFWKDVQ